MGLRARPQHASAKVPPPLHNSRRSAPMHWLIAIVAVASAGTVLFLRFRLDKALRPKATAPVAPRTSDEILTQSYRARDRLLATLRGGTELPAKEPEPPKPSPTRRHREAGSAVWRKPAPEAIRSAAASIHKALTPSR